MGRLSDIWKFVRAAKWTFAVGGLIALCGIVGVIYAVSTGAGDEGFLDNDTRKWDRASLPISCAFDETITADDQINFDEARNYFNHAIGREVISTCVPWGLRGSAPFVLNSYLLLRRGVPPSVADKVDGVVVNTPFQGHTEAATFFKLEGGMGPAIQGAVIYIDSSATQSHIWRHELGHVLGLAHDIDLRDSLMHSRTDARSSTLTRRDVDRLRIAYQ
jgi:hypothetical protein